MQGANHIGRWICKGTFFLIKFSKILCSVSRLQCIFCDKILLFHFTYFQWFIDNTSTMGPLKIWGRQNVFDLYLKSVFEDWKNTLFSMKRFWGYSFIPLFSLPINVYCISEYVLSLVFCIREWFLTYIQQCNYSKH